ncbi:hypothetical protein NC653_026122 [Populus alba x Populus x berolinensis]|uniref:Uncharacterized protein n=1 Tax=Populus alba x Populus x berolinensis TaxID=444605 RepID=A0AAD6Q8T6_9ROSI|nr:hypothetical protein NC653_026122 [Populus alba x Populus x berolinensis]
MDYAIKLWYYAFNFKGPKQGRNSTLGFGAWSIELYVSIIDSSRTDVPLDETLFAERIGKVVTTEALILASISDGIFLQGLTESSSYSRVKKLKKTIALICYVLTSKKLRQLRSMDRAIEPLMHHQKHQLLKCWHHL